MPGQSGVVGTLLNGGTAGSAVDLTFPVGSLAASAYSTMTLGMVQGSPTIANEAEFDELFSIFVPGATPTVNFCTPFLATGVPTSYFINVRDIFDAQYSGDGGLIL